MPSSTPKFPTESAPNDASLADSFLKIDHFLTENAGVQQFKVEDDNQGMGMISTVDGDSKKAVNVRLDKNSIQGYLLHNGFERASDNDSVCTRKPHNTIV
ncbi:hypothetical protein A0J61_08294 [Choanephora cucurbitarum]|uniref:Uncharacterized protein n=1 Tax=Choanephora cucurbitarum TaxID=101091 RepID=A0A1C7N3E4_9FUNG|nr:hypothetical protein A0J61_08294 [Choanephora cucurbitarum]